MYFYFARSYLDPANYGLYKECRVTGRHFQGDDDRCAKEDDACRYMAELCSDCVVVVLVSFILSRYMDGRKDEGLE